MRVLYISQDGLTDPLGQSQVLPYLIGLSKRGHSITILSCEKENKFRKTGDLIQSLCNTNSIEWHPVKYRNSPPVIGTLMNIRELKQRASSICASKNIQVVHCRSYLASLVGVGMKHQFNVKFIFDMRGFWPDERVEGKIWNLGNPVYKTIYNFFKRKEKEFLREADHIVSLTAAAKNIIDSWKVTKAPITLIPTCTDLNLFDPGKITQQQTVAQAQKLGLDPNDFILLYHGSWGTWYMKDEMLDFFTELKRSKPRAKFVIATQDAVDLGDYPYKSDVISYNTPRAEMPVVISLASICLFFIRPSFSKAATMPTKLGEVLAFGVPVVTNKGVGDMETILKDYRGAYVVDGFTGAEYRKAIEYQLDEKNTPVVDKELTNFFSLERGVGLYDNIYRTIS